MIFDSERRIEQDAHFFNAPPIVKCESNHGGTIPPSDGFLSVTSGDVIITAIKRAEDDDSVIVRGYEPDGKSESVSFTLCGHEYGFEVEPYEIFTLKLCGTKACKVNMLEE